MVNIGLRVLHRPDMTQLPAVYRNLGKDYDDRVLPSIMNEVCMRELCVPKGMTILQSLK